MISFLRKFPNKEFVLLSLIFVFGFVVRFYNFAERVTFGPEQAISLITSGNMIKKNFSLLGQENVQRIASTGHKIYSGALFSYSLIPLQLIFNFNPMPITAYFALLNIFTALVLFLVARKMFSDKVAFISTILFLFNFLMIYHSLFFWILNYLPLVGILIFYFLFLFVKKRNLLNLFFVGILFGVGFSLEYTFVIYFPVILFFVWKYSNKDLTKNLFLFFIAVLIPNLSFLLFEFRHNFYQTHILFTYLTDLFSGKSSGVFRYYNFLPLVPILCIGVSVLLDNVGKRRGFLISVFLVFYVFSNLRSAMVNFDSPVGMPKDLTVLNI